MPRFAKLMLVGLLIGLAILAAAAILINHHSQQRQLVPAGQQVEEDQLTPATERGDGTPTIGGPFTLQSAAGPVTEKTLLGHYTLIYFGYSHCPDVCPTVLATIAEVFQKLPAAQRQKLRFSFISVDPDRDPPASLQAYVSGFNPTFQGWTGTPAQLTQITHEYLTYYAKRPDPKQPGAYSMDHSSIIYLIGPDGQFVTNFGHADSAASILAKLAPVLQNG